MSDLKQRVGELLKSLGDTADEVAGGLRQRGIKGAKDDGCCCPIANLIKAEFPEARDGKWSDDDGAWFVCESYVRTPDGVLRTRATAIGEFIEAFDEGIPSDDFWCNERPYADLEDE